MAEHTGVDQLIQYADGQLADVLGAQVVQNQQVGLLTGGQPLVVGRVVEVLAPQLRGQRGGACVQYVVAALQHGVGNRQRQMCLAQAGVAHEQQVRAALAEFGGVAAAVVQQFAHVLPRGDAQLRLHGVAVALDLKAGKLAQAQRAGGIDLVPAQTAGGVCHAAAGDTAAHTGILTQRAAVGRLEIVRAEPGLPDRSGQRFICAGQRGAGCIHVSAKGCGLRKAQPRTQVGAVRLGQKLCTKEGPIQYPRHELPDDTKWGEDHWNKNYRNENGCIQTWPTGTAPCKAACPAHIAVQGYINLAAQGRYLDALKLIKQDNPFPAVCGSICNRRCEEACTRGDVDRAVAIDEIKKFVAEQELQADKRYIPKVITHRGIADPYPEKIAIIGAGPAGLSCAYYLANMGYENVTVFDKNEVPGGMLTLGIPSFRLEKDVVNAEIEVLKEMGVHFQCGVEIGKDLTIDQLREQGYKGSYLAIGAQKSAPIGVPGEDLSGVYGGVDFLRKVNLGKKPRIGKKCAVIGGGNVAMDVCRTAIRLGAKDTYIIYRRSQAEMPADAEEVAEAMEEGVQFRFLSAPAEIIGENGKVKALKVEIMELGEPDAKGRRKPVGTGKFETIEVTSVIGAIGQRVDLGRIAPEAMAFNRNGTVQADGVTYQTAQPDIFAGGDVVTGPKFAIDAIAAGREGAVSLHRFVHEGQSLTLARDPREFYELDKSNAVLPIDCFDAPARQTVAHDASKAKTFSNDRITFTEAQVKAEASRCLGCGVSVVDQNKCIGCGLCTTRCEFDAIHLQRDMPEASRMYRTEDKMKAILPHMVKRAAKLTIKDIKGKRAK